jgi:hypothetical protein
MKLLNVLLIASIALTAFGIANAQPTIQAYSVVGVTQTSADHYTATVNDTKSPVTKKAPLFTNGEVLVITTTGCTHVPAKGGENGIIVVNGTDSSTLLFTSAGSCAVVNVAVQK